MRILLACSRASCRGIRPASPSPRGGCRPGSRWVSILVVYMVVLASAPSSRAERVSLQDVFGGNKRGQPFDAEKYVWDTGDVYMCWLALASNVLAWGGWFGRPALNIPYRDEDYVF